MIRLNRSGSDRHRFARQIMADPQRIIQRGSEIGEFKRLNYPQTHHFIGIIRFSYVRLNSPMQFFFIAGNLPGDTVASSPGEEEYQDDFPLQFRQGNSIIDHLLQFQIIPHCRQGEIRS